MSVALTLIASLPEGGWMKAVTPAGASIVTPFGPEVVLEIALRQREPAIEKAVARHTRRTGQRRGRVRRPDDALGG